MKELTSRLFLDLGRIKQRGDNRGGPNTHRNPGLHQFRPALLTGPIVIVVRIAHGQFSMAFGVALEAA